jgi:hypothetical protein
MEDKGDLWERYFASLSDVDKSSYDGSCTCMSCQAIRKGFDDYVAAHRHGEGKEQG